MNSPYTPEELHQITLRNRTHPEEFEERDDIRFCDHCGAAMDEGYCIGGDEHYCSDDCLKSVYSEEEIANLCIGDDDSESYWTTWWENRRQQEPII